MKRKLLAMVCAVSMIASLGAATVYASDDVKATGDEKIALITMDSIDQHWITLNEGAQEEAKELGVTVDFMSPNTKDDAQQIECVNNAVAGGYDAIMVAANGPDAISSALQEAKDQGIKIVYVDSPANVEAEATFSTDNKAAGTTAGEEMKKALEDAGITSGKIGVINVNAATDSCISVIVTLPISLSAPLFRLFARLQLIASTSSKRNTQGFEAAYANALAMLREVTPI